MSISGGSRHHDQQLNKVTVIGGGDLGMASVMSILSKVITFLNCMSGSFIQMVLVWIKMSNSLIQMLIFFSFFFHFPSSVKWISLFSSTSLRVPPKAEAQIWRFSVCPRWRYPEVRLLAESSQISLIVSKVADSHRVGPRWRISITARLNPNQLLCCSWLWTLTPSEGQHKSCIHQRVFEMRNNTLSFGYFCYRPFFFRFFSLSWLQSCRGDRKCMEQRAVVRERGSD